MLNITQQLPIKIIYADNAPTDAILALLELTLLKQLATIIHA